MTDDEIVEKLRSLSPIQLSDLLHKLLGSDVLTNKQRQVLLELQAALEEESKQRYEKMLELSHKIHKCLRDDSLSIEQRQNLERVASMIAGYLARSWLPPTWAGKFSCFCFWQLVSLEFFNGVHGSGYSYSSVAYFLRE